MLEKLQKLLRDYKDDQSIVISEARTFAELEFDSLATVEFLMNLEDELGIRVETTQSVKTVGELIALIEQK